MTDIIWGPSIEVNGKRPEWLADDDGRTVDCMSLHGHTWIADSIPLDCNLQNLNDWNWRAIKAIRLPADHFAYTALAKGFVPWGGGENEPLGWDGGEVLLRRGEVVGYAYIEGCPSYWENESTPEDIIGYKRLDQPVGYRFYKVEQPAADTVTLERMTWAQAREQGYATTTLDRLGLLRPETQAERMADELDIDLEVAQKAIEWMEVNVK